MKCPRCNSDNVQMQSRVGKNHIMLGITLLFSGIGLMIFGFLGLMIAVPVGLIIGAIIKALMPNPTETVAVCQTCGYTSKPIKQTMDSNIAHPLFCSYNECTMSIHRESASTGAGVPLTIRIDAYPPFTISSGMSVNLKLETGFHRIAYEQSSGLGKKNRTGFVDLKVEDGSKYYMRFLFTSNGLSVTQSW